MWGSNNFGVIYFKKNSLSTCQTQFKLNKQKLLWAEVEQNTSIKCNKTKEYFQTLVHRKIWMLHDILLASDDDYSTCCNSQEATTLDNSFYSNRSWLLSVKWMVPQAKSLKNTGFDWNDKALWGKDKPKKSKDVTAGFGLTLTTFGPINRL